MGYSHGKKWTIDVIKREIMNLSVDGVMPSYKDMDIATGNKGLSCAISKHGGYKYFADILGLKIKHSETTTGRDYEIQCLLEIEKRFGYFVDQMTIRHPYDLLVENAVKIDVKVSNIVRNKTGEYYSFNLEKKAPTCDIFVCYCIDKNKVSKIYIIPSTVVSGKCQLSLGVKSSIYDNFINQWHFIEDYVRFFKEVVF